MQTAKLQLSDNLKTCIEECQGSCIGLMAKFDRRIIIDTRTEIVQGLKANELDKLGILYFPKLLK